MLGYRIEYKPFRIHQKEKNPWGLRIRVLTATFGMIFCITFRLCCPEGNALLSRVLLPGEPSPAEHAFAQMMEDLRSGETIEDSVTVFCKQILDNGKDFYPQS